jgi:hypothetical protein
LNRSRASVVLSLSHARYLSASGQALVVGEVGAERVGEVTGSAAAPALIT